MFRTRIGLTVLTAILASAAIGAWCLSSRTDRTVHLQPRPDSRARPTSSPGATVLVPAKDRDRTAPASGKAGDKHPPSIAAISDHDQLASSGGEQDGGKKRLTGIGNDSETGSPEGRPPAPTRSDARPEEILDRWWHPPAFWTDRFGVEQEPLPGKDNPEIALEAFLNISDREGMDSEEQGCFEVATDRTVDVANGVTTGLTGRVVDGLSGIELSGAEVVLFSAFYKRQLFYDHHLQEVAAARTGLDGRFTMAPIHLDAIQFTGTGKAFLTVRCDGYVHRTAVYLKALTPGSMNDVGAIALVGGGATVRGHVLDRRGMPVADAMVAFSGEIFTTEYSKDQRYLFLKRFPHAYTDASGRFELSGLSGKQWVSVHVGADCVESRLIDLTSASGDVELVFRVTAGGTISGTVVDADGNPVPDAVISGGGNATHSYGDGAFVLENFQGDPVTLVVRHHLFCTHVEPPLQSGATHVRVTLDKPLPRMDLNVFEASQRKPFEQVRVLFLSQDGGQIATTRSPLYVAPGGAVTLIVPEHAATAVVSAEGAHPELLDLGDCDFAKPVEVFLARREE